MPEKIRLDVYMHENALAESREKARFAIIDGLVYVNGQKAGKPGAHVKPGDRVEVRGTPEFVSRGGLKLKKALDKFSIDLNGKICVDVGASTGGFTDCMLQNGAAKVYCVDAGHGQLAKKLLADERAVNLERTNIRYLTRAQIPEDAGFVGVDVSFISLELVLNIVYNLLEEGGGAVCLIKPQFEAGREKVGKNGVVREKSVHAGVIEKIVSFSQKAGFNVLALDYSPIKGPEGNIEYLLHLARGADSVGSGIDISGTVRDAHNNLSKGEDSL